MFWWEEYNGECSTSPVGGVVHEDLMVPLAIVLIFFVGFILLKKAGTAHETVSNKAVQSIVEEMHALLGNRVDNVPNAIWSQTKMLVRKILVLQSHCQTRIRSCDNAFGDCMELQALDEILVRIKRDGIVRCAEKPREAQAIINDYRDAVDQLERAQRVHKRHLYA